MAKPAKSLTKIFTSVVMSGFALWSSMAHANEGDDTVRTPTAQVETATDSRGINDKVDDYFAHKFSVRASRDSFYITGPERFDVRLFPSNSVIDVTREYLEVKPLRKEWYGHSSGIAYGMQANIGQGSYTIGGQEWNLRTGFNLAFYNSPDHRAQDSNSRAGAYVEGVRPVTVAGNGAYLITGVSYSSNSGPDVGNDHGARVYTQLDMPAVFSAARNDGIGKFSATFKAYAGTDTSGTELGVYYNDLKSDGKGMNFSVGPEFRYDHRDGVTYRFRVRVAPKFW